MGDKGCLSDVLAQGPCRDPERRRMCEQGMDGGDGKSREAVGAARARERQSRWERPYGVGREGCYQES